MCAVLHHAVIWNYAALDPDFYHEEWMKTLDRYTRHTSPAAGKCRTDVPGTAMSAYWNDEEILLVFANLTEREVRTAWRFSPDQTLLTGEILLPPMRLTVREMRRECMGSQTGSR